MTTSQRPLESFEVPNPAKAMKNAEELARRVLAAGKHPTPPKKETKRRKRKK